MLAASMTRFVAFAAVSGALSAIAVPLFAAAPPSPGSDHKVDFERHLVGVEHIVSGDRRCAYRITPGSKTAHARRASKEDD